MSDDLDLRDLAVERPGASTAMRSRHRWLTRYLLPIGLLVGFLALILWSSREILFPPREVTVVPVFSTTSEVRQEGTPLFNAAGWIEPRPTPIRVAALATGVVEELLVVEDEPIAKGQPIAEMVKDDARLAHQRALADMDLREAERDEAEAAFRAATTRYQQPVHLEAELGEAEASLAKVETDLKNLPFQVKRAEADFKALNKDYQGKLASEGVVAGVEIDIAKGKVDAAKALVEELSNRLVSLQQERTALLRRRDALQTRLELLADEIKARDAAKAQVKAAEARVAQAAVTVADTQLQLDRMTVTAPTDGRVFRLIAHPGARIGSGMTQMEGHDGSTVVTMYRPDQLQVRVDVRFEDLPKVQLQQPVRIDNPALSTPLVGEVLFISSEADIQKNTLQVKVAIPEPPAVFKPEMLVDVTFLAAGESESTKPAIDEELRIYVVRQLIRQSESGPFVWIADQSDGVARRQSIETGATVSGKLVEVVRGLSVDSRIITGNVDGLRDGDRIKISSEDAMLGVEIDPESNK